ncbi:MAG: HAD-IA family hydrolase [Burkholderiales bacterium]
MHPPLSVVATMARPSPIVNERPRRLARNGKFILFDLGGVLVEATGRTALRAFMPQLGDAPLLERWHRSNAVQLFERGKISPSAFAKEFIEEWQLDMGEAEFLGEFASWVNGFFDGAAALIQALRTRHHVGCLSNTNAIHWARLPEISRMFDSCFPSHVTGFMKPDRMAYVHALDELHAQANDVYFFDDLVPNVAAAREV